MLKIIDLHKGSHCVLDLGINICLDDVLISFKHDVMIGCINHPAVAVILLLPPIHTKTVTSVMSKRIYERCLPEAPRFSTSRWSTSSRRPKAPADCFCK